MSRMNRRDCRFLLALSLVCLAVLGEVAASSGIPAELIGTWDYMSLTIPSGARVHFKPGQWTLKLSADATWTMQGPTPNTKPVNGTYEVRGNNLKMHGGNDLEYHFSRKHGGKDLQLRDKKTVIDASRE
jgi:hypothetical protein